MEVERSARKILETAITPRKCPICGKQVKSQDDFVFSQGRKVNGQKSIIFCHRECLAADTVNETEEAEGVNAKTADTKTRHHGRNGSNG